MHFDLIRADLAYLYGEENCDALLQRVEEKVNRFWDAFGKPKTMKRTPFNEEDVVLITYGDIVQEEGKAGIASLHEFLAEQVKDVISRVHILPFFPYSSDDGFSVIDYLKVADWMGDWDDVNRMHKDFRLMFDMVVNHVSVESDWFQGFLAGEKKFEDYFITVEAGTDLSAVFRPRALPLLTAFEKTNGEKVNVWTTFSADQVDINYGSEDLLMDVVDVMLAYVGHGASYLRLDAVAFIWKEIGTSCLHLPEAHRIVTLMRHILDVVAPDVVIITETNVPHVDNISYFGNGYDEAQMVYNFSLPPLVLYSFHQGTTEVLTEWARQLKPVSDDTTFFNFLASHDGVGVMPARGLLQEDEILAMAKRVEDLGGLVSYKTNSDGSLMPYELNVNYLSALGEAGDVEVQAKRFLASQAIMLALQGVPGIYFHSLFGSENWLEGVEESGQKRTINREKPKRSCLEEELSDETHLRHFVFEGYKKMLQARKENKAFSPLAAQKVLNMGKEIFAVLRGEGEEAILCVVNVCEKAVKVNLEPAWRNAGVDLLGAAKMTDDGKLDLDGFQVCWLKME